MLLGCNGHALAVVGAESDPRAFASDAAVRPQALLTVGTIDRVNILEPCGFRRYLFLVVLWWHGLVWSGLV